jgi:predicted PurR-regulated permease PerM
MDSDRRRLEGWPTEARILALWLAGLAGALYLAWQLRYALVLAFTAVVLSVILDGAVRLIRRGVPAIPRPVALAIVAALLVGFVGVPGVLIGAEMQQQFSKLLEQLPMAIRALEELVGVDLMPRGMAASGQGGSDVASAVWDLSGQIASMGMTMVGGASAAVVVIVAAFYLTADPGLYRSGVLLVVPYDQHARVMAAMSSAADALRLWLGGQLLSMAIVGTIAGLGTWWIGLPAPLALAMFAAFMEFIPMIGPFIGAVPALLLALAMGGETLLWTVLLFIVLQQVEGNVVAPIVQRRMAKIPPGLLLFSIVAAGLLFGLPGVIVAAPMAVVVLVLVKQLYVRDVLGKETALPGDDEKEPIT